MSPAVVPTPLARHLATAWSVAQLQVGWLACVAGAAAGRFVIGPAVVAVLLAIHLAASQERRRDLVLMAALGVAGSAIDSTLAAAGLLSFRGAPWPWLCPLWITALWLHFATSRDSLFAALRGKPRTAAVVGLVGGPLAYGAGVRLGAASFHPQPLWSVLALALVWAVVLPAATRLAFYDQPVAEAAEVPV